MPVHDYVCPDCGRVTSDQYHPAVAAILCCPTCHVPMEKSWERRASTPFKSFTVDIGGGPTEITSLGDVRRIERDSEKAARDGRGQHVNFRAFSNDRSNQDVNTLGHLGHKQRKPVARENIRRVRQRRP